jgi:hypothetical protein
VEQCPGGLGPGLGEFDFDGGRAALLGLAQVRQFGFEGLGPAFGLLGSPAVLDALLDERRRALARGARLGRLPARRGRRFVACGRRGLTRLGLNVR